MGAGAVTEASGLRLLLDALAEATTSLTAVDLSAADVAELASAHDALRGIGDKLGAMRARIAARIEEDGRWANSGTARTFPEWVARRGGASVGAARREVALGHALESEIPAARREVTDGRISLEHAQVLSEVAATSDARRAALASDLSDRNEAFLLAAARRLGVDDFRRLAERWAAAVDQAADEAEHRAATEREYLRLVRRRDGVDIQGFLAAENAELLATALRAVSGVPAADDPRTPEQRQAATLAGLAQAVLDHGLESAGTALVRPHLLVHVPYEAYLAIHTGGSAPAPSGALEKADGTLGAPAELDDGTPLSPSAFARIACDASIRRVVFDPAGQPLDVGRSQRTFTGPQRAAVIARDKTCRYPGCSAPPIICEVHHVTWWSRGGGTEVSNGILLCAFHHRQVHRLDIVIQNQGAAGFEFRRRDGSRVPDPRSVGCTGDSSSSGASRGSAVPRGRGGSRGSAAPRGSGMPGGSAGPGGGGGPATPEAWPDDGGGRQQVELDLGVCA